MLAECSHAILRDLRDATLVVNHSKRSGQTTRTSSDVLINVMSLGICDVMKLIKPAQKNSLEKQREFVTS